MRKKVLQPSLGCRVRVCFFFSSGNMSFAGLSNSVLVGCFKF